MLGLHIIFLKILVRIVIILIKYWSLIFIKFSNILFCFLIFYWILSIHLIFITFMWYISFIILIRLLFSSYIFCQCWKIFSILNRRSRLIVNYKLKIISHPFNFRCSCFVIRLSLSQWCFWCLFIHLLLLELLFFDCWPSKNFLKSYIGIICNWCTITFDFCDFLVSDERTIPSCSVRFIDVSISSNQLLCVCMCMFSSKNRFQECMVLLVSPFFIIS